ncbi:hypothetical protein DW664_01790 [Lachnospiraceae bacterium AM25-11LB]|nr:hypothetical protein DW675_01810 [Lachnospiraceae bacterium AM25-22]RGD09312.1 hypothetical protein DW664_01790 [Lachnospiraceae bacterium AM25-11LB]RJW13793.1 hypothetical protein DW685_01790 [Lachnospiraceae bacterium AM25-40]RJW14404.1 hypothetical protein DW684_11935 [Lachnospiraceae bacterium AM25-39]
MENPPFFNYGKGRQHFLLSPLDYHQQGQSGLSTVGEAHSLAVDWLGWVWYLGKFLILIYFYRNKV